MLGFIEKSHSLLFLGIFSLLYLVLSIVARITPCLVVNFFDNLAFAIVMSVPLIYPLIAFWSESYWFFLLAYSCMFILFVLVSIAFALIQRDCFKGNGGEIAVLGVPVLYLLGIAGSVAIYAGIFLFRRLFQ